MSSRERGELAMDCEKSLRIGSKVLMEGILEKGNEENVFSAVESG